MEYYWGVGGAKLALGFAQAMSPEHLGIVVNVGDDFEHLGLHISPDIDTVMYALSGLVNRKLGWGREGESWNFMGAWASSAETYGSVWATRTLPRISDEPAC